jgi:predicted component of type VI protein secretion system
MKISLSRLMAFYTQPSKYIITVLITILTVGCATMQPIPSLKTASLEFRTEKSINNGKKLPIDIIYISYVQELREVTRFGPELWFEGNKREEWKQKESISIEGGQTKIVELNPRIMERTVLIVVMADYEGQKDPRAQQVIIDYAGRNSELILVREDSIMAENKSLQYVK